MHIRSRHKQLLERVNDDGVCSVRDLAKLFDVSEMTIRRDINHLSESRLLVKVGGGAQKTVNSDNSYEEKLQSRLTTNLPEKQLLAAKAMEFIHPNDVIFLDGSTTIVCLSQMLKQQNPEITVVTNSILVVMELVEATNIKLISLGGFFDRETFSYCPLDMNKEPFGLHVKKAFLSCTGIVLDEGTYENSIFNKTIKQIIAHVADEVYLLANANKLGKRALSLVLSLDDIDVLVTEPKLEKQQIRNLELNKIRIEFSKS